jgi:hypothetical protein
MWKLYVTANSGIAIRTTCRRLCDALKQAPERLSLYKVAYADQTKKPAHGGSMIRACLTKRQPFAHEKEVRLMWWPGRPTDREPKEECIGVGFYVACDMEKLMERVYVAPTSARWFSETVKDITRKYGIKTEVVPSALGLPPP